MPPRRPPRSPDPSGLPRPPRSESREVAELRQIRSEHPELASAIDMQIELLDVQRRVQSRIPLPWFDFLPEWVVAQQREGRALLRFSEIPIDWSDLRLAFRQAADILRRHDALEPVDHERLQALARDGNALEAVVTRWYNLAAAPETVPDPLADQDLPAMIDQVLTLAMRPFLSRCAEAVWRRTDLSAWTHPRCPLCGGDPDIAVINASADRLLICSRCGGQWRFHSITCPFCLNDERSQITSFTSRDGRYRIYACEVCRRYLKAYDARRASRPVMPAVDTIATLPLDAAAIQKGYKG